MNGLIILLISFIRNRNDVVSEEVEVIGSTGNVNFFARDSGFPVSNDSNRASSSCLSWIKSPMRRKIFERSVNVMFFQGPFKALLAAETA